MNNEMKSSLTAADTWTRGLFMLLFVVIYSIAEFVLGAVVFFQFIHVLATREINERLRAFTTDVSVFIYQTLQFLTFNSEVKPYPFAPWPDGPADLESLDMLDNIQTADETGVVVDTDVKSEPESEAEPAAEQKPVTASKSKPDPAD
ncbi:MAG: hypothetical protein ACI8PP_002914 [Candidatus Pseudothioglobus sp.]|jgi:hypothetical protein